MEEKNYCPLCKKELTHGAENVSHDAHEWVIGKIKKEHPQWVERDGACPKCIAYYKNLPPKGE